MNLPGTIIATLILWAVATSAVHEPVDQKGRPFRWSDLDGERLVAVVFLGVDCPLVRLYAPRLNELSARYAERGVRVLAVDSNLHDSHDEVVAFAGDLQFTMVHDPDGRMARALGARRSPEAFLLDARRNVIYRGRIDDQYEPGIHGRGQPTRRDLQMAIDEALAGRPISVPVTEAAGCHLDLADDEPVVTNPRDGAPTYAGDIAAIFDARCVECHRPGQAAPFSLLDYDDAVAWSATIRDVVAEGRMPPWSATGGPFVHDRRLTPAERDALFAWIDAGMPRGDLSARPAPPRFSDDWQIRADRVLTMPTAFRVPAEGVLDYHEVAIDPGFGDDTWVSAVEIRPGNRAVVHHVNVYTKPPGARADELFVDSLGDYYLAMAVPGNSVTFMPAGCAKLIPAGWNIVLSIHYVPNGTPQLDQTSVALTLADPRSVRRQMATRAVLDDQLVIEPGEIKTVRHSWRHRGRLHAVCPLPAHAFARPFDAVRGPLRRRPAGDVARRTALRLRLAVSLRARDPPRVAARHRAGGYGRVRQHGGQQEHSRSDRSRARRLADERRDVPGVL